MGRQIDSEHYIGLRPRASLAIKVNEQDYIVCTANCNDTITSITTNNEIHTAALSLEQRPKRFTIKELNSLHLTLTCILGLILFPERKRA